MAIKTRTPAAFGSSWSKHWLVPGLPLDAGTGNIYDWTNNPALWPWNCDCLGEWPTAWFLALASILDHWENEHVLLLLRWPLAGSWPETSGGIWNANSLTLNIETKANWIIKLLATSRLQLDAGNRERLYLRKNICAKPVLWCFYNFRTNWLVWPMFLAAITSCTSPLNCWIDYSFVFGPRMPKLHD